MSNSVLIIDGDPTFAENAQEALEAAGLTVHVRFDVSLEDVRNIRPQVLMLSAELPRGSGFGVCSRIRRDRVLRDTAIFITTSEATQQALARHARSSEPANDYARKDIPLKDLVDRVGRLLAQAPTLMINEQQVGPVTDRMASFPPPLPMGEPPPNGATASASPGPVSGTVQLLELWPREALDTEFRQALTTNDVDPLPKGRATPEERLLHLRQLVKQHEAREKTVRQLWDQVVDKGQALARRVVTVSADLVDHKDALENARRQLADTEQQKSSVEGEFQRFEEEIRRIFSEKDEEEKELRIELDALKSAHTALTASLAEAHEQRRDDQRRLAFIQEELDNLTTERERVNAEAAEVAAGKQAVEQQLEDLTARLQTAEHIAKERAETIEALQDQLDQLTYETEQRQGDHAAAQMAAIDALADKHSHDLADLQNAHRAQLASLTERHQTDLDRRLAEAREEHTESIRDLTAAHEGKLAHLNAARDDAEAEAEQLRSMLAEAKKSATMVQAQADAERARLEARVADLEAEQRSQTLAVEQLERALQEAHSAAEARIAELERSVEAAENRVLDAGASLDQEKAAYEALEVEYDRLQEELSQALSARDLSEHETAAQADRAEQAEQTAEERTVRAEEAEKATREREERITLLEAQKLQLENQVRDTEAMIEATRMRLTDAETAMLQTEQEADRLRAQVEEHEAEREEARVIQDDLEAQVTKLARERSGLHQTLAETEAHAADQQAALQQQLEEQEDLLNESRFAAESIRAALVALSRDLIKERHRSTSPRIHQLLDRVERVARMSLEALSDDEVTDGQAVVATRTDPLDVLEDAATSPLIGTLDDPPVITDHDFQQHDYAAAPDLRAGSTLDDALATESTRADHPMFSATANLTSPLPDDGDDEGNVTEIIDLKTPT